MEVGFRHENFDLLLREAELYLNGYTNVEFCLLIDLSLENGIPIMRIILCRRQHDPENFQNDEEKEAFRQHKADLKKEAFEQQKKSPEDLPPDCGKIPTRAKSFRNVRLKPVAELQQLYSLIIVEYITVRLDAILHPVTLPIDLRLMLRNSLIEIQNEAVMNITIPVSALNRLFRAFMNLNRT